MPSDNFAAMSNERSFTARANFSLAGEGRVNRDSVFSCEADHYPIGFKEVAYISLFCGVFEKCANDGERVGIVRQIRDVSSSFIGAKQYYSRGAARLGNARDELHSPAFCPRRFAPREQNAGADRTGLHLYRACGSTRLAGRPLNSRIMRLCFKF